VDPLASTRGGERSTHRPARSAGIAGYVRGVFRFRFLTDSTGKVSFDPSPLLTAIRFGVVAFALVTSTFLTPQPHFPEGARGITGMAALGVTAVAWVAWLFARRRERLFVAALAVLAASGGVLAGLSALSPAIAVGCVVTSTAGLRLRPEVSLAITAETVAAFIIAGLVTGAPAGTLVGYPFAYIGLWAFGLTRHAFLLRAEEAERMLEQTRRARAAETQTAALAERTRIAREIHDVLAHSLAAVSVNLQAAEGLLAELPDQSPELATAIECIERAGAFTREGLTEARHAINALRDNAAPLPDQLAALAAQYRADGGTVSLSVSGTPRLVPADASLTVYRTAQEALTNARKHAPGQPVTVGLEFAPAEVVARIANPLAPDSADRPLAATGGGHGLTGLRERAALSSGTLTAGPSSGGQWQVCLRIPA
jgi:signal transduction histidine kinase